MHHSFQKKYRQLLTAGLVLIGAVMIVAGLIFSPSFVAERLSSDGILAKSTITKLWLVRWGSLSMGVLIGALLSLYGVLKLTGSDYASRLDRFVEELNISCLKQPRTIIRIVFVLLALIALYRAVNLATNDNWKSVIGYEYYYIAESIIGGHGFSFPATHRWYFGKDESQPGKYYPTAHEEPVYPFLLSLFYKGFGEYGWLIVLILQIFALSATAFLIYYICYKIYHSHLGVLASIYFLLKWPSLNYLSKGLFNPAIFAGFMICVSTFLLLSLLKNASVKKGIILGLVLGISSLILALNLLFIPLSAICVIMFCKDSKANVKSTAFAIVIAAVIVISPWTIRNAFVFGKFIPVKSGLGTIAIQSNPILAATFTEGRHACVDNLGPLWKASNAKEAIHIVQKNQEERLEILRRSHQCIQQVAPLNYDKFNEAERDKFYMKKTFEFIRSEPKTFLNLAIHRIMAFYGWSFKHTVLGILAFTAVLLSIKKSQTICIILIILAYSTTFILVTPYGYRYRYPIEPLFFVLVSYIPIFIYDKIELLLRKFDINFLMWKNTMK